LIYYLSSSCKVSVIDQTIDLKNYNKVEQQTTIYFQGSKTRKERKKRKGPKRRKERKRKDIIG
jgi:hypothetical protein